MLTKLNLINNEIIFILTELIILFFLGCIGYLRFCEFIYTGNNSRGIRVI